MPRRAEVCLACQHPFEIGETFQALLFNGAAGYERRDYCLACRPTDHAEALATWRTRRPEPAMKRVRPFDREAICGFFERLADADEPNQVQFRFVLGLLLWRKRVLKLERTITERGRELWEFLAVRTGAVHRVERPDLAEEQLERLSVQLEQLLAGQPGELDIVGTDVSREDEHA